MKETYYLGQLPKMANDDTGGVWIQAAPFGSWQVGPIDYSISRDKAERMVENFRSNVRGHDVELDYDHKQDPAKGRKASGWVQDMEVRDDGLYTKVKWTPTARTEIANEEWKYFSLEWSDEWEHPTTHQRHKDVVFGGGLTNRPQHKGRLPINASELALEFDMSEDAETPVEGDEPKAQKPDGEEATPNNPVDPNVVVDVPKHKEPGTAPDFDTPPHPADDDPAAESDDDTQEGNVVNLDVLRKKLGLSDDADEAAVMAAIDGITAEVEPLRKVASEMDRQSKFASEFPDEYAEHIRLVQESRERRATEFAATVAKISDKEQLAPVAVDKLEQAFMASEAGSLNTKQLAETIAAVTDRKNIVDFGEQGSSRASEVGGGVDDFVEKIKQYQASDNLGYGAAVMMAAERHPELYQAYRESVVHVQGGN